MTKICAICKKEFIVNNPNSWAYKATSYPSKKKLYFCTYKCKSQYDKSKNEGKK